MLVLEDKTKCTGCSACAQKCSQKCIKMIPDEEGFLYPHISDTECIHCGICTKVCPQENESYLNKEPVAFWGGMVKDEALLKSSSSGGAFSAICMSLDEDAIICGATYDDELKVHHSCCKNGSEIEIFRKSKYLQSDVRSVYSEIKQFLKDDKTVLFSGTACQVAGLYAHLGNKPDKLYTVDLICHGVPSQKVFDAYISSLGKHKNMKISRFSFRDKSYFWGDWEIGTAFGDKKQWKHQAWGEDYYMTGFLRGLFYRPSCYQCKYANSDIQRPADLTIGDFWGSGKVNPQYNDKKGSSLIVVNSIKGQELLDKMKSTMKLSLVDRNQAIEENHNLIEPTKTNPRRGEFFVGLSENQDFMDLMEKFRKGESHSQKIRVIVTKLVPWIVEKKRIKVREERKAGT